MHLNSIAAADISSALSEADSGLSPELVELVTAAYEALNRWQSGQTGSLTTFVRGE